MIDAAAYGKALFDLACPEGRDEIVRGQLHAAARAVTQTPGYVTLMDTPAVATEEKLTLLREAFGECDEYLRNFLCILCRERSMYALGDCCEAFDTAYDEHHGILRATAATAVAMSDAQRNALCDRLHALTGRRIVLENRVDPALLGGVTLRYGSVEMDDSIRGRLERLRRSLQETTV